MNNKYFVVSFLSNRVIIDSADAELVDSLMRDSQSNREDFVRCQYEELGDIVFSANTNEACRAYIKENYPNCDVCDVSF